MSNEFKAIAISGVVAVLIIYAMNSYKSRNAYVQERVQTNWILCDMQSEGVRSETVRDLKTDQCAEGRNLRDRILFR